MTEPGPRQRTVDHLLGVWLFRARWLLAPIYFGLVLALAGLVVVFLSELVHGTQQLLSVHPHFVLVTTLSMIDLALAANLVLIVIISGYEQFIGHIQADHDNERLGWMGAIGFAGVKLKLIASLVAISAVALLRAFVQIADGEAAVDPTTLSWMIGIHLTFVVSGLLLALIDYIAARTEPH